MFCVLLIRYDSRVSADYQQFCVSACRHGAFQLRRLLGWNHRWRTGLSQVCKYIIMLMII